MKHVSRDLSLNGIDIIHWNARGQIVSFKVMVRPLRAINIQLTNGKVLEGMVSFNGIIRSGGLAMCSVSYPSRAKTTRYLRARFASAGECVAPTVESSLALREGRSVPDATW